MFKFYFKGEYCRIPYESQETCSSQARLVSAIYRDEACVVDMRTGEVVTIYDCGLHMD